MFNINVEGVIDNDFTAMYTTGSRANATLFLKSVCISPLALHGTYTCLNFHDKKWGKFLFAALRLQTSQLSRLGRETHDIRPSPTVSRRPLTFITFLACFSVNIMGWSSRIFLLWYVRRHSVNYHVTCCVTLSRTFMFRICLPSNEWSLLNGILQLLAEGTAVSLSV